MSYTPTHLTLWTHPSNYGGKTWEGWYSVMGQTRDSDTLTRSNYRTALKRLQEVAKGHETDEEDPTERQPTVMDTRCSHFLCGWVETIYVWSGDEEAVRTADEILDYLANRYGCLDSDDWYELESKEAAEYWESMTVRDRVEVCARFDVSIFAARRDEVPSDPRGELVSYLADGC